MALFLLDIIEFLLLYKKAWIARKVKYNGHINGLASEVGQCTADCPWQWLPGVSIPCTSEYEMSPWTPVQKEAAVCLKKRFWCDTLGDKIIWSFVSEAYAVCAAFSPGITPLMWAMGADRRWATGRYWAERIKECGRWQGHHGVYSTQRRGAFSPGWAV